MVDSAWLFKGLAVLFLFAALPLPIIVINNKKMFPAWENWMKQLLVVGSLLIAAHHFFMTFIFVMFLPEGHVF